MMRAQDDVAIASFNQNSETFRSLNQLMWQIPLIAMTLTGGLWFGVSKSETSPLFQICLLGLSTAGNVGLLIVLYRLRYVMERYLSWLQKFDENGFVSAPGKDILTKPYMVRSTFQILLLLAAITSVILMVATMKTAGWLGDDSSARAVAFYERQAKDLAENYELIPFEDAHPVLFNELGGKPPRAILDVGAGTGRDVSWMAANGHSVIAVEPAASFRALATRLHPNSSPHWLDDRLPKLEKLTAQRFDWIVLSAVWMHVHPKDRPDALARLKSLLTPSGKIYVTLRSGPPDQAREIYPVTVEELRDISRPLGLKLQEYGEREDLLGRTEVKWRTVVLSQ
ncbi:methyltransferase domain-containing protein (plasmid) [Rhizobium phaseoli]|uniref:class I SAM-dependent methyltransferase n=1 Tax=Rhizobium phaseoli TaxID=396 RepID=UPI0007F0EE1C|nr:class I SAM-dependent methyltransferase [Rhizobium phaseoli]ANL68269.1 methyltransferase domain-containing protein [Rhizobium phaseoli]ANL81080.1 methyltransferase domain-containing protein [Rhizobium phaseoli]